MTEGELDMSDPVPNAQSYREHAFFSYGFRPFFLGAALFAGVAIPAWMVMLAGGLYLGPYAPAMARMLVDGEHCAWYPDGDAQACAEVAHRYLADDRLRERVRTHGERFVREYHTYDQRINNLLTGEPWVNPLDVGLA